VGQVIGIGLDAVVGLAVADGVGLGLGVAPADKPESKLVPTSGAGVFAHADPHRRIEITQMSIRRCPIFPT
jgi:hypothetical protein